MGFEKEFKLMTKIARVYSEALLYLTQNNLVSPKAMNELSQRMSEAGKLLAEVNESLGSK